MVFRRRGSNANQDSEQLLDGNKRGIFGRKKDQQSDFVPRTAPPASLKKRLSSVFTGGGGSGVGVGAGGSSSGSGSGGGFGGGGGGGGGKTTAKTQSVESSSKTTTAESIVVLTDTEITPPNTPEQNELELQLQSPGVTTVGETPSPEPQTRHRESPLSVTVITTKAPTPSSPQVGSPVAHGAIETLDGAADDEHDDNEEHSVSETTISDLSGSHVRQYYYRSGHPDHHPPHSHPVPDTSQFQSLYHHFPPHSHPSQSVAGTTVTEDVHSILQRTAVTRGEDIATVQTVDADADADADAEMDAATVSTTGILAKTEPIRTPEPTRHDACGVMSIFHMFEKSTDACLPTPGPDREDSVAKGADQKLPAPFIKPPPRWGEAPSFSDGEEDGITETATEAQTTGTSTVFPVMEANANVDGKGSTTAVTNRVPENEEAEEEDHAFAITTTNDINSTRYISHMTLGDELARSSPVSDDSSQTESHENFELVLDESKLSGAADALGKTPIDRNLRRKVLNWMQKRQDAKLSAEKAAKYRAIFGADPDDPDVAAALAAHSSLFDNTDKPHLSTRTGTTRASNMSSDAPRPPLSPSIVEATKAVEIDREAVATPIKDNTKASPIPNNDNGAIDFSDNGADTTTKSDAGSKPKEHKPPQPKTLQKKSQIVPTSSDWERLTTELERKSVASSPANPSSGTATNEKRRTGFLATALNKVSSWKQKSSNPSTPKSGVSAVSSGSPSTGAFSTPTSTHAFSTPQSQIRSTASTNASINAAAAPSPSMEKTTSTATATTLTGRPKKAPWKAVEDPSTGRTYFYHRLTRQTTWTKPKELTEWEEAKKKEEEANNASESDLFDSAHRTGVDPLPSETLPPQDFMSADHQHRMEQRQIGGGGRGAFGKPTLPQTAQASSTLLTPSSILKKSPAELYRKRMEITRMLESMSPPDKDSVDRLVNQYDGREDELLAQLKDMAQVNNDITTTTKNDTVTNSIVAANNAIATKNDSTVKNDIVSAKNDTVTNIDSMTDASTTKNDSQPEASLAREKNPKDVPKGELPSSRMSPALDLIMERPFDEPPDQAEMPAPPEAREATSPTILSVAAPSLASSLSSGSNMNATQNASAAFSIVDNLMAGMGPTGTNKGGFMSSLSTRTPAAASTAKSPPNSPNSMNRARTANTHFTGLTGLTGATGVTDKTQKVDNTNKAVAETESNDGKGDEQKHIEAIHEESSISSAEPGHHGYLPSPLIRRTPSSASSAHRQARVLSEPKPLEKKANINKGRVGASTDSISLKEKRSTPRSSPETVSTTRSRELRVEEFSSGRLRAEEYNGAKSVVPSSARNRLPPRPPEISTSSTTNSVGRPPKFQSRVSTVVPRSKFVNTINPPAMRDDLVLAESASDALESQYSADDTNDTSYFDDNDDPSDEGDDDGDYDELTEVPDDVSGLSASDAEFAERKERFERARRKVLDRAIRNKDWEMAASLTDNLRLEQDPLSTTSMTSRSYRQPSRVESCMSEETTYIEWTQGEIDRFIARSDWDAVASYIAFMRDTGKGDGKHLQTKPSGLSTSRNARATPTPTEATGKSFASSVASTNAAPGCVGVNVFGAGYKKRFGARSQLQHDLHSVSTWGSDTSYDESEDYTSAASSYDEDLDDEDDYLDEESRQPSRRSSHRRHRRRPDSRASSYNNSSVRTHHKNYKGGSAQGGRRKEFAC